MFNKYFTIKEDGTIKAHQQLAPAQYVIALAAEKYINEAMELLKEYDTLTEQEKSVIDKTTILMALMKMTGKEQ